MAFLKQHLQLKPSGSNEADLLGLWAPLLDAGLTVTESVQLLAETAEFAADRQRFQAVLGGLKSGLSLSQAVVSGALPFSQGVVQGLAAAEQSGKLGRVLALASSAARKRAAMRDKAWAATRYPLIVGFMAVAIIIGLVVSIVPRFQALYDRLGSELPIATQMLIALSDLLNQHHVTVLGIGLLLGLAGTAIKATPWGQRWTDRALNNLPVIGRFRRHLYSHSVFAYLELLISAGVTLPNALRAVSRVTSSPDLARQLERAATSVRGGQISERALEQTLMTPLTRYLWVIGVRSGRLPEFLGIGHRALSDRLEHELGTLTSLLEPVLMASLGIITGLVMLALYQPIFSLGDAL